MTCCTLLPAEGSTPKWKISYTEKSTGFPREGQGRLGQAKLETDMWAIVIEYLYQGLLRKDENIRRSADKVHLGSSSLPPPSPCA